MRVVCSGVAVSFSRIEVNTEHILGTFTGVFYNATAPMIGAGMENEHNRKGRNLAAGSELTSSPESSIIVLSLPSFGADRRAMRVLHTDGALLWCS